MGWLVKKLAKWMDSVLEKFSLRRKLFLLYIFCVLIPIVFTDGVILKSAYNSSWMEKQYAMSDIASAVQADVEYIVDEASNITRHVYINRNINELLDYEYANVLDFVEASHGSMGYPLFTLQIGSMNMNTVLYGDNSTIVNGGMFYNIDSVRDSAWYRKISGAKQDMVISFFFVDDEAASSARRKFAVVRRLNYFKDLTKEKLIKVELNYSYVVRRMADRKYSYPVYVCQGNRILLSNADHAETRTDFALLSGEEKIGYRSEFQICGDNMSILILDKDRTVFEILRPHLFTILLLLIVNILLPIILMGAINRSFTARLETLGDAFDHVEAESLMEIENITGSDEISLLMMNYNRMVRKSKELIKTVYMDKLEQQEMDISRQRAELLALHSQINPHFLFNVLESIRMHSLIRHEDETAHMIECLANLERQNFDWSTDYVRIDDEIQFSKSYLELQKCRFGDNRLQYDISVEEECKEYRLPKLSLVTFVENACVHGAEHKVSGCKIFVRIYKKDKYLMIEVEDTGEGMESEEVESLMNRMNNVSIDSLINEAHVGIANACLRLKMVTGDRVWFDMESEKGIGTFMTIKIEL